jgi:hypothetical protein
MVIWFVRLSHIRAIFYRPVFAVNWRKMTRPGSNRRSESRPYRRPISAPGFWRQRPTLRPPDQHAQIFENGLEFGEPIAVRPDGAWRQLAL